MNKQMRWIIFLVGMLALASLSCAIFGIGESEPTEVPAASPSSEEEAPAEVPPTAVPSPTAVAEPTQAAPVAPETAVSDNLLLDTVTTSFAFDSYQFEVLLDIITTDDAGNEVTKNLTANIAATNDPNAMSLEFNMTGFDTFSTLGGSGQFSMTQIESTNYMVVPELGCVTLPADQAMSNPAEDFIEPGNFLESVKDAEYVGDDVVNGIEVAHYRFDKDNLNEDAASDFEELNGDLYIAKDGGYLVRLTMAGTGSVGQIFNDQINETGNMMLNINLTSINEPLTVEIPAACAGQTADTAYPVLDNAIELASMSGLISYQTETAVADVIAFYDEELANDGWTKNEEESFQLEGTAILAYTKDDQTLSITIGADPTSGNTFVLIISE